MNAGQDPDGLDKEFVRKWLVERMEDAYESPLPTITDDDRAMFSAKYQDLYKRITGQNFIPAPDTAIETRVLKNLKKALPERILSHENNKNP